MSAPTLCVPGMKICRCGEQNIGAAGTYERNGYIIATLAGYMHSEQTSEGKNIIEVRTRTESTVVPSEDSIVTARITNVSPRYCRCAILSVGKVRLPQSFRGMIRKEDVRATEKDKVELYKCFRPGDIVLARVLSLGDALSYLLTTAENELGVVMATGESGVSLVPISWCEMQCPVTMAKESRKVAKVQPQFIETSGS